MALSTDKLVEKAHNQLKITQFLPARPIENTWPINDMIRWKILPGGQCGPICDDHKQTWQCTWHVFGPCQLQHQKYCKWFGMWLYADDWKIRNAPVYARPNGLTYYDHANKFLKWDTYTKVAKKWEHYSLTYNYSTTSFISSHDPKNFHLDTD